MTEVFSEYQHVLIWVSGISLVFFAASLTAVPWLIARIPPTYFSRLAAQSSRTGNRGRRTMSEAAGRILMNLAGFVLVIAGVIMLFIPGQGLLTILAGLVLIDFPGKRQLVICLVRQPKVQKGLNWIRRQKGVPPLIFP